MARQERAEDQCRLGGRCTGVAGASPAKARRLPGGALGGKGRELAVAFFELTDMSNETKRSFAAVFAGKASVGTTWASNDPPRQATARRTTFDFRIAITIPLVSASFLVHAAPSARVISTLK